MALIGQGSNLIFLISLPRSGSTMLQKILCSNQDVATVSEPWIMLHPLYALREQGYSAEYNALWTHKALKIFLDNIQDGEDVYYEGLRLMFSHVYESVLRSTGKKRFMDKTPRYYEIIPELNKVFPDAKFVVLLRNPMAVLNSRIGLLPDQKYGKDLGGLKLYERDLLYGPGMLLEGIEVLGEKCFVLKYEDFVLHPDVELKRLCNYLGLTYSVGMLEYNKGGSKVMEFGDPVNVYENKKPNAEYREKWVKSLANPQLWRLFSEYFECLGYGVISRMGYSPSEISNAIGRNRPGKLKLFFTKPMNSFLHLPDKNI